MTVNWFNLISDAPKDSKLPETLAEPATLEEIDQVVTEVDDLTETVTEPAADVSESEAEPVEEVIETATQVPVEHSENFETHLEDEPAEVPSGIIISIVKQTTCIVI